MGRIQAISEQTESFAQSTLIAQATPVPPCLERPAPECSISL